MYDLLIMLASFIITFIIGYLLISRVPSLLHTPLMSMTNAISAVTIIGAILIFSTETTIIEKILGTVSIIMAIFNVFGGFVITHRMLRLFSEKYDNKDQE